MTFWEAVVDFFRRLFSNKIDEPKKMVKPEDWLYPYKSYPLKPIDIPEEHTMDKHESPDKRLRKEGNDWVGIVIHHTGVAGRKEISKSKNHEEYSILETAERNDVVYKLLG